MTDAASDTLGNYFRVCKEKGKPGLPHPLSHDERWSRGSIGP